MNKGEIILYQPDDTISLEVRIAEETVWLTQAQMLKLFQKDRTVITRHINNIFKEGELDMEGNVHFLHFANSDRPTGLYNLDVIISVGYRVKSQIGTSFPPVGQFSAEGIYSPWLRRQPAHRIVRKQSRGTRQANRFLRPHLTAACAGYFLRRANF